MPQPNTARFLAAVKLIERTGARSFRLGYSDPEEGEPVVWYACASWGMSPQGALLARGGRLRHEAAGAMDGETAALRLCELVIDGGTCAHCGRPTLFVPDTDTALLDLVDCVYAWDPELKTFRRDCEGETPGEAPAP